jgi:gluconate 2-dehydrogenase gamma chain
MSDHKKSGVSRRELLKRAGLAGAALTIPVTPAAPAEFPNQTTPTAATHSAAPRREQIENLTAAEMEMLEAICARIIPTDANGPGAREARAAHYIDRALGGALSTLRHAYTSGLAAFDAYCRSSRRAPFLDLSARDQDSVLIDVETGAATGFQSSSGVFFAMVRTHTLQGTFGDPYYGGNANFVGWDLLGYPGVRTNVSTEDQRLGVTLTPNHRSAYDTEMFNKASASAAHAATADKQAHATPVDHAVVPKPQVPGPKPTGAHHGH